MLNFYFNYEQNQIVLDNGDRLDLTHPRAFNIVCDAWLRAGWDVKYVYGFTWLGRPIIQLPEDLLCIQEVIYQIRPDVVIETGVAHGGSLVFYASLFEALGHGRVIGVDLEIRQHNRLALEGHFLFKRITLIEGDSVEESIVSKVKQSLNPDERVLVILDSSHSYDHVTKELSKYSKLVTVGSYIVVCDGIMAQLSGAPRSKEDWYWNNPLLALEEFVKVNSNFEICEPTRLFNESLVSNRITYWPRAFLKRIY